MNVTKIYWWFNEQLEHTCGLYKVSMGDKDQYFLINGDSVGVICHFIGRPASECVATIRDDVKQEFLAKVQEEQG